uniref:Ectodermal-neural cortex 2 n=1 Tax=Eptatretus burgeri TaxID=7764 RepID=A0A8C4NKC3_EPTBU
MPCEMDSRKSESQEGPEALFYQVRHPEAVLAQLNSLRHDGQLTDVVLLAGGAPFPCHRAVLAACSSYFQAMFGGGLRESHETEVNFHDSVAPEALGLLLDYAYTSRISLGEEGAAEALLQAADMLQFPEVRDACAAFLERHLRSDNCLSAFQLADAHGCSQLREQAFLSCLDNFVSLASSSELVMLPGGLLKELVASDDLNAPDERIVIQACLDWARYDLKSRHGYLAALLEHVRFVLLPSSYFKEYMLTERLVMEHEASSALVKIAFEFKQQLHCSKTAVNLTMNPLARPRRSGHSLLVFGGRSFTSDGVFLVDVASRSIVPRAELPSPRKEFSACALGSRVYVTGGRGSEKSVSKDTWVYDAAADIWSRAASMLVARFAHGSAELSGCLYVVGGHTAGIGPSPASPSAALKQVERYEPKTNTWHMVASLHEGVSNAAAVSARGNLFVFGGTGGVSRGRPPCVQCYRPTENCWDIVASCPQPWRHTAACPLGDHVFVLGGDTECAATAAYRFSTVTLQWSRVGSDGLSARHLSCHAVACGRCLFVVGGYSGAQRGKMLDTYDPATDTWENVASIPYALIPTAFVSVWKSPPP